MGVKLSDLLKKHSQPQPSPTSDAFGDLAVMEPPAPPPSVKPADVEPSDDDSDEDEPETGFRRTKERRPASSIRHCGICGGKIRSGETMEAVESPADNNRRFWAHTRCAESLDGNSSIDREQVLAIAKEADRELQNRLLEVMRPVNEKNKATLDALQSQVEELKKIQKVEITLKRPDKPDIVMEELTHPAFAEVLELAHAREEVFMPGPAGCGKTTIAAQVAKALGLKFGFISCSAGMSESQLLGRRIPSGEHGEFTFVSTQFIDCYENGGVFLFDEIDAADSNVLLVINSALANGRLSIPSRNENPIAERHKDFVCIAAANTFGRGADRLYSGRSELDEATLDRFKIGTVVVSYDERLERKLCPNDELYRRLVGYRKKIEQNRLERVLSTRFIAKAYRMVSQFGWSLDKVDSKLFAAFRPDEVTKVRGF